MTHYRTEIEALHRFFQDWFNAALPRTDEAFIPITRALSDGFTIVMPHGALIERAPLIEGLRRAYGSRRGIRIWIENVRVHVREGGLSVVLYEEWQRTGEETTARRSTAVFRDDAGAPYGLTWLHVHETWLPQPEDA